MLNRKLSIFLLLALFVGMLLAPIPRPFAAAGAVLAVVSFAGLCLLLFLHIPGNVHRPHLTLTAAVLASVLTLLLAWLDVDLGWFSFPQFLLAEVFSGGGHSPPPSAHYSGLIIYFLLFLFFLLVIYAVLLERYLIWASFRRVSKQGWQLTDPTGGLRLVGEAFKDAETYRRRKRHFLLKDAPIDLNQPPDLLAANLIARAATAGSASLETALSRKLLAHLKGRLRSGLGADRAQEFLARLQEQALARASNRPDPGDEARPGKA